MPELIREIERVIFETHPSLERDGAADFEELLDMRAGNHRDTRDLETIALAEISDRIGQEMEKNAASRGFDQTNRRKKENNRPIPVRPTKIAAQKGEQGRRSPSTTRRGGGKGPKQYPLLLDGAKYRHRHDN
ncbi:hypothetical protein KUL72_30105 [Bradyrhizobium arachidis]|uniref:hypothetical protein n=1 Tax=Bradyrhizobium arachidis TaxID=858423 RepID=UPI00216143A9|nr:hypothetical protein [Bradyrhizobium arachidis]UVO35642.1 hypothetical protein KUL72_30105 [Bradyrhizobium arachidis]